MININTMEKTIEEHCKTLKWKEIGSAHTRTFQLDEKPEVIHIIKTGFKEERFIVVFEDAYGLLLGKTMVLNSAEIKNKFDIEL